jgi:hypothetical protein
MILYICYSIFRIITSTVNYPKNVFDFSQFVLMKASSGNAPPFQAKVIYYDINAQFFTFHSFQRY